MAPRFKQPLFQIYDDKHGGSAFVGFPLGHSEQMYTFRDTLRDEISQVTGFAYRSNVEGPWEDIDVHIRFFDGKDEKTVDAFYSKPWPGCLSWLLRTRKYADYKSEEMKVKPLIKIEIVTSHDFPCITIESSILAGNSIAQLIKKVARDLNIEIVRSNFPYTMNAILMSNSFFDADANKP